MAFCNKCGQSIPDDRQFCSACSKEVIQKSIKQTEKEIKGTNRAHWIGIIVGGIIAGLSAKILRGSGVSLGFIPAVLLWLAAYWIVKKFAEKM